MDSSLPASLHFSDFLVLISVVVITFAQYVFGYLILAKLQLFGARFQLAYKSNFMRTKAIVPLSWMMGLLVHLALGLIGKCLLLPWIAVTLIPFIFIVALQSRNTVYSALQTFSDSLPAFLSPVFLLWLIFHTAIGYSLFFVTNDIKTPWVNNYGDLTFHLGMIHHFTFVGDFPAQYHLYAGERLSYPFFINFWSALLWWPSSRLISLPWIFLWQWIALWSAIFVFLNGKKYPLIPWVLLFGGGSYFAIMTYPNAYSWSKINEGYPFTTWLSTIWVTQRSAMLGAAASLASVWLLLNRFVPEPTIDRENKNSGEGKDKNCAGRLNVVVSGIFLGLMPLVHTHFFIFTALFIGLYLGLPAVWQFINSLKDGNKNLKIMLRRESWIKLYCVVLPSLMALLFFPLLLGKSGMISFMPGWSIPLVNHFFDGVGNSAAMWIKNAPQWFLCIILVGVFTERRFAIIVLAILFVLGNFVKLAVWEWDQLKVFLVIFTLFLCVWSQSEFIAAKRRWFNRVIIGLMCASLSIPGIYEFSRIIKEKPNYQVYSPDKITMANFIRHVTPKEAIIVSASDHNASATLAGRTMYMGYPGTLASHKIDYQQRERIAKKLNFIEHCSSYMKQDAVYCPSYVVWDRASQNLWRNQKIPPGFKAITDAKFPDLVIYQIEGEKEQVK